MKKQVLDILQQAEIPLYGIAPMPNELDLISCRAKSQIPKDAKSVIVCLFPYYSKELENGNISKYAMVEDYHKIVGEILDITCYKLKKKFDYNFRWFVDNSPIPEVQVAVNAGLGFMGRNGLLITHLYGTYQFVGEIVTDMPIDVDAPNPDSCIQCGKCEKNCPGKAISEGEIDISKCASNINQLKRNLHEHETELVKNGGLLWGCDICQEVCPHNKNIEETPLKAFKSNIISKLSEHDIPELVKTRAFGFRGSKPLLRNYRIIYPNSDNNKSER